MRPKPRTIPIALALAGLLPGCGYSIRPPFDTSIQTVYVPVVKSVSFRRDVNLQMTELLQKEIERRTPFKVVGRPEDADTTLEATITQVDKNAWVENPNNLPRQIAASMAVDVRWVNNATGEAKVKRTPPVRVVEYVPFFPELGETTNLAYQKLMAKLVQDVVGMMEDPW